MLTLIQIAAILGLLNAFGVDQAIIKAVEIDMTPSAITIMAPAVQSQQKEAPTIQLFGSQTGTTTIPAPQIQIQTPSPVVQLAPVDKSDITIQATQRPADAAAHMPYGSILFFVGVLDSNGSNIQNAPVTISEPSNLYGPQKSYEADNQTGNPPQNNWYSNIVYIPTTSGGKTITFTSGNLTKTYTATF